VPPGKGDWIGRIQQHFKVGKGGGEGKGGNTGMPTDRSRLWGELTLGSSGRDGGKSSMGVTKKRPTTGSSCSDLSRQVFKKKQRRKVSVGKNKCQACPRLAHAWGKNGVGLFNLTPKSRTWGLQSGEA